LGFDITDNLNILLGVRYFEAESDTQNTSLNADGVQEQNCLEEIIDDEAVCIQNPSLVTADNRLGISGGFSSASEEDTLPLVTISYAFGDDVLSYITASEGFRIGGTNLLRATSSANETYLADKILNTEIGLKSTLMDGRFVFNIAAYSMVWEDMQLVTADPTIFAGWGQVTSNAGEAEIKGIEANFALAASERWTFDGAITFTDSEVTEGASIGDDVVIAVGEQLPLSPELKGSLGVEYGFPVGNSDGYLRLDYSYTDEQTNATSGSTLLTSSVNLRGNITTMPSYSIGNLMMGWGNESWSVRFSVKNITDERAMTYKPTRWTDGRIYSVRPREFTMNYRYNF
jgi:outer membrane receptor protein involved in Fe transport